MTKRSKKERNQVGLEIDPKLNELLESAVAELGGSRASNVLDALNLCFPIWFELKRQQKAEEHEQIRAALEVALGKRFPEHFRKTADQDQDQETPRRKRK
jgi:hypothetical protein